MEEKATINALTEVSKCTTTKKVGEEVHDTNKIVIQMQMVKKSRKKWKKTLQLLKIERH